MTALTGLVQRVALQEKPGAAVDAADYFRVRAQAVVRLNVLAVDLYLKVSADNFVKVVNFGEPLDAGGASKYVDKDVQYFYVKKEDYPKFLTQLLSELSRRASLKEMSLGDALEVGVSAHEIAQDVVARLGITPETNAVIRASVDVSLRMIRNSPDVSEAFDLALKNSRSFISCHSILVGYTAPAMATLLGWSSETTFHKLALAAFLHDITLTDERVARCSTLAELKALEPSVSDEETRAMLDHPAWAAQLAARLTDMPPDLDTILVQHHERPDGSGFPARLKSIRIDPLACVFIVAEDFVTRALDSNGALDCAKILERMSGVYTEGLFKKLVAVSLAAAQSGKAPASGSDPRS